MRRHVILGVLAAASTLAAPVALLAQVDTTRSESVAEVSYRLDAITIVAYGRSTVLRESALATSVVTRRMIEQLPIRTLPDILSYVPGIMLLERDGSGQLPMAVARGFFGGGETAYVRLMIDGVPVNDMRTGTVDWQLVPLSSVQHVEILRGGASTMYGDAALGAVVNVVTRDGVDAANLRAATSIGAWGERSAQLAGGSILDSGSLHANGAWSKLDGFREHSSSEDVSFTGTYRSESTDRIRVSARASGRRLIRDEPGPLPADLATDDPRQMNPLYSSDHRVLDVLDLTAGLSQDASATGRWTANAAVRLVDDRDRQTLLLASDFGDTQVRDEQTWNLWTRFQFDTSINKTSVTAGTEVEYGEFATKYLAPDDQAAVLASGSGDRLKLGLYAEGRQRFTERWNVFAGLRLDVLEVGRDDAVRSSSSYSEWSPRVGANFAYSQGSDRPGHAYVSVSRSFKAPTLDQLYDVRAFPAGESVISISNPGLQPQTSTAIEAGILQRLPLWKDAYVEMDLAAYRLRVDDEIDFDVSTFRFGNIQESRHDGLELSLTARLAPGISLRHSSTLVRVVIRSGDLEGNGLKNIPRSNLATALSLTLTRTIELSLVHRHTGSLYLDDENSHEIPGYHRFSARANWKLGSTSVFMSVNNLFDERASSLGFLSFDPASGQNTPFVYPIGGRALRMGISLAGT